MKIWALCAVGIHSWEYLPLSMIGSNRAMPGRVCKDCHKAQIDECGYHSDETDWKDLK